jgi:hypothetical protein
MDIELQRDIKEHDGQAQPAGTANHHGNTRKQHHERQEAGPLQRHACEAQGGETQSEACKRDEEPLQACPWHSSRQTPRL